MSFYFINFSKKKNIRDHALPQDQELNLEKKVKEREAERDQNRIKEEKREKNKNIINIIKCIYYIIT